MTLDTSHRSRVPFNQTKGNKLKKTTIEVNICTVIKMSQVIIKKFFSLKFLYLPDQ